jgi:hypothetical protein
LRHDRASLAHNQTIERLNAQTIACLEDLPPPQPERQYALPKTVVKHKNRLIFLGHHVCAYETNDCLNGVPAEQSIGNGHPGPIRSECMSPTEKGGSSRKANCRGYPTGYLGQFHRFKSKLHFQEVLGFAAALTAAAGFLLDKLPESRRKEFARRSLIQRQSGSGSRSLGGLIRYTSMEFGRP